ncbi:hypothetical protein CEXT_652761 [Caerostris extrusa]|uniref:Uncharacterized protein n=1 Tax=Caerostris extrusa TaxID=172846 RepID=A0AAV4M3M0_CAEEX|nr:hypothetical protein CEXT_652761 [Caerostris extrusa]
MSCLKCKNYIVKTLLVILLSNILCLGEEDGNRDTVTVKTVPFSQLNLCRVPYEVRRKSADDTVVKEGIFQTGVKGTLISTESKRRLNFHKFVFIKRGRHVRFVPCPPLIAPFAHLPLPAGVRGGGEMKNRLLVMNALPENEVKRLEEKSPKFWKSEF